jgi:phosphatidate cytidylyltransferase
MGNDRIADATGEPEGSSRQRVALAFVAVPALALFVLHVPPVAFAGLVLLVCGLAVRELCTLGGLPPTTPTWLSLTASVGLCASFHSAQTGVILGAVVAAGLGVCLAALAPPRMSHEQAFRFASVSVLALLYVAVPLGVLILLRRSVFGASMVWMILLANWSRDAGAFIAGRMAPGHPALRPDLNRGKHLVGALGGAQAVALVLLVWRFTVGTLDVFDVAALTILVGAMGQAGDLFESLLKRQAGARHSGRLLHAQGGMLDSIDGLLFTAPAVYGYLLVAPRLKALFD